MFLRGIEFHTEESPQAIIKSTDGLLSLKTNKGTVDGFSHVMFATGRRPNTKVWDHILIFICDLTNLSREVLDCSVIYVFPFVEFGPGGGGGKIGQEWSSTGKCSLLNEIFLDLQFTNLKQYISPSTTISDYFRLTNTHAHQLTLFGLLEMSLIG